MKIDLREEMRQRARAAALELKLSERDVLVVEEIAATHAEVEILAAVGADVSDLRRVLEKAWGNLNAAVQARAQKALTVALTGIVAGLVRGVLTL